MIDYRLIDGHPDYRIGSDGSFWSRKKRGTSDELDTEWRRVAPSVQRDRRGYLQICMYEGGQRTYRKLHQLVLEAFVGPRPADAPHVRHLDGNPQNNALSNLRWGTAKENQADCVRHGTRVLGVRHHAAKLTPDDVVRIRARRAAGEPIAALGAEFGVSDVMISKIARREWWRHVP